MNMDTFIIMIRQLFRNRTFSFINIFGLATGIAASLIIYLVIKNELSYDNYHVKKDRIYRIVTTTQNRSNLEIVDRTASVPMPLPVAMKIDFPQFEKVATVQYAGSPQVYVPGKSVTEGSLFKENSGVFYAEPALFEIFDYAWLSGNGLRLSEPHTVVLSKTVAEKYFGDWKDALGKTIELWSWRESYLVTGVFSDLPSNTDIPIRLAMSSETLRPFAAEGILNSRSLWRFTDHVFKRECFVLLSQNQNINSISKQLPFFIDKYYKEKQDHLTTFTNLAFQPLKQMHLDDRFDTFKGDALPGRELWSLGIIGLFLVIIVCINFVNLATAQSINRAKEIGVRKVLGSDRVRLIWQFLGESATITFLSILLSYLFAAIVIPYVSQLIEKPLSLSLTADPSILLFMFCLGLVVTLLAGFYPAVILSGFHPVDAIKSKISTKTVGGISLRRSLVILQFALAQLLIIGTIVVFSQMNYFRNRPMGFEKKAIAVIDLPSDSADMQKYDYMKNEMLQVPGVMAASYCMDPPSSDEKVFSPIYFENQPQKLPFDIETQYADTSYLNTFGIRLLAGRLPYPSDTIRELLVNETLVRKLGLASSKEILGKRLSYNSRSKFPVVGVIHDFNSRSLRDPIMPLVLSSKKGNYTDLAIRMEPEKLVGAMRQIREIFTGTMPSYIYDPVFFDESIWQYYKKEAVTFQLFRTCAALSIILSCLGLFGLVSFVAIAKTKEIGIRKLLGASIPGILFLFTREFIILITVASLIATPLGYYFMHQWLSGFYNHINLGWYIFVLGVLISLGIAFITVAYTTFRAANANPVKSLRSEG
jgi:putative ABC transport system permease protein